MFEDLIRTKIHIPGVRTRLIGRQRLKHRLDEAEDCKLTLVSAPAGFGKTSLLAGWSLDRGNQPAWFSIDPEDNDPRIFWKYFSAAITRAYPDIGVSAMEMLQSPSGIPVKAVVRALVNEIFEKNQNVVLILDDFHLIDSDKVLSVFKYFIDYMPDNMRLIISTRTELPFSIGRLKLQGHLQQITTDDLRFTAEEAAMLAGLVAGRSVSESEVLAIAERCEGWSAGLQMAFLAGEKKDNGSLFPRMQEHIIDYFMGEVFLSQPEHMRSFLLETSILSRLNPPLCDAVTGRQDSAEILAQLRSADMFLVELDRDFFWHRYHQMFADALYARLAREHPGRLGLLHSRAAQWFKENRMPGEAIHHAIAARDWNLAVQLVTKHAAIAIIRGNSLTALRWIRALPESKVTESPYLCITYAWALFLPNLSKFASVPYSTIEYFLAEAEKFRPALLESEGPESRAYKTITSYIDTLRVHLAYCRNAPRDEVIKLGEQTLQKFSSDNVFIRTNIFFTLALTYLDSGDLDACSACLEEARSAAFIGGFCYQAVLSDAFRCGLARIRGRLRESEMINENGLRSAKEAFVATNRLSTEMLAYFDLHKAYLLLERNYIDEAERAAERALEPVKALGETHSVLDGYTLMFYIRLLQGAGEDAVLPYLRKMENLSVYCARARPLAAALRIRYLLTRFPDDAEAVFRAYALAEQYGLSLQHDPVEENKLYPVPFERMMRKTEMLSLIHLYLSDYRLHGDGKSRMSLKEVTGNLNTLLEEMRSDGLGELEIDALILLSVAHYTGGDEKAAIDALKKAVHLGDPEGFFRIFVNKGVVLVPVLEKCIKSGVCVDFAARVLQVIRSEIDTEAEAETEAGGTGIAGAEPETPLSRQEQAILRMIATGLTNQEIAENLCISVATVKTHNYNIFKKLNVSNRVAAAEKARQMGIEGRAGGG
ncbi:MAG: LuxR C-terminal-related transcriptional regulator [Desulfobacteraceae bacterium]|nr:LuxR C-terminal-related transcriptional regulator [Desulfobacteraceae bacterium]